MNSSLTSGNSYATKGSGGSDARFDLLTVVSGDVDRSVVIVNEGAAVCQVSLDGGSTWPLRVPAGGSVTVAEPFTGTVSARRIPSGTDVTGIWAYSTES